MNFFDIKLTPDMNVKIQWSTETILILKHIILRFISLYHVSFLFKRQFVLALMR